MLMLSGWTAFWDYFLNTLDYLSVWFSTHYVEYHGFRVSYGECALSFMFITLVIDVVGYFIGIGADGYEDSDDNSDD